MYITGKKVNVLTAWVHSDILYCEALGVSLVERESCRSLMVPTSKGYVVITASVQFTEDLLDGSEIHRSLLERGVRNKQPLGEVCSQSLGLLFITPIRHN